MGNFNEEASGNSPEWIFREVDEDEVKAFAQKTGFSRTVSKILILKGIKTEEELKNYINGDIYSLFNPFKFNQMIRTVFRVRGALNRKEKIFIFGDRDVDGVLSTAMLYNMLNKFDADVIYKVPEGEYGYGIENRDIDFARDQKVKLIITVDTGISSMSEIDYAISFGIDTIIIDHHVQTGVLPNSFSILNPKIGAEQYPFKDLSAGGVVLKFIHAFILSFTRNFNRVFVPLFSDGEKIKGVKIKNCIIGDYINIEESIHYPIEDSYFIVRDSKRQLPGYFNTWLQDKRIKQIELVSSHPAASLEELVDHFINLFSKRQKKCINFVRSFIDLSAISTISDIMPLTGENRIIVKQGLKQISNTENLGLKILLSYCDLPEIKIAAKDIAWNVSPIINSAGRMGDAHLAVKLFTTHDVHEANELSRILVELNEKRKEKGKKNLGIIRPLVAEKYNKHPIIVLSTDKAEYGVTGVIASKISKEFSKPTIIIVNDGNTGIGSGRGGRNFDLVDLVSRCSDLLDKYGGHKSAVGFTIDTANIEPFIEKIHHIASSELSPLRSKDTLEIDDRVDPEDITFQLLNDLEIFEPSGAGNEIPVFYISGTTFINPMVIGRDKNHIKFYIPTKTGTITVLGWGLADKGFSIMNNSSIIDIMFSIEDNSFRGERELQLILHDIRASENID